MNMADGGGDDIFVYLGGDHQEVPDEITHAVIDPSVKTVRGESFWNRRRLVSVIFHDGVEIIEEQAFSNCISLSGRMNLLGVRDIGDKAFDDCVALSDVYFGDRLETIGFRAFNYCMSLRSIKVPSVRTVLEWAFCNCEQLTDVEFGIDLETIAVNSFYSCQRLQRIAIPLKDNIFPLDPEERQYNQFQECRNLTTVDIVGADGIHNTISSLLLESWKDDMSEEINRINQELRGTNHFEKTRSIRLWVRSVIDRLEHYKAEHNRLLKEHMTQLELAVWKTRLDERDDSFTLKVQTKRAKIDEESSREEKRITSGADIIIKNILPFLKLA